jgi:hypothetical protein
MENGKRIESMAAVAAFVTAGAAIFTLRNPETGRRFTFRVRKTEKPGALLFVSVLTGADNTGDYEYLGCIFEDGFRVTKKSRIRPEAPSARAFEWFWRRLSVARENPAARASLGQVEVWHCGRCGKCGRVLTVPESIESGLGPVCARGGLDGAPPRSRRAPVADDRHLDLDDTAEADERRARAAEKARENAISEEADRLRLAAAELAEEDDSLEARTLRIDARHAARRAMMAATEARAPKNPRPTVADVIRAERAPKNPRPTVADVIRAERARRVA